MIALEEARLARAFGSDTLERAREYVRRGRVMEAFVEPSGRIRGVVKGSEWKPYEQKIAVDDASIDGLCTCPVAQNCKHVAAVLLDLMGQDEVMEAPPPKADPQVEGWLRSVEALFVEPNAYPADVAQRVFYVLGRDEKGVWVDLVTTRALKGGGYGKPSRLSLNALYSHAWPRHVLPIDVRLIESLARALSRAGYESKFRLAGPDGGRLLPEIVATGRCVWEDVGSPPLVHGPARQANLTWEEAADGSQVLRLDAPGLVAIGTVPSWYLAPEERLCGELHLDLRPDLVSALVQAPPVPPESVETVRKALGALLPGRPDLLPSERRTERRQVRPTPVLQIGMKSVGYAGYGAWRKPTTFGEHKLPVGRLLFDYEGIEIRQGAVGLEVRKREGDEIVIMPRRPRLEGRASTPLLEDGWIPARAAHGWRLPTGFSDDYLFPPESDAQPNSYRLPFYRFLRHGVSALRESGWKVEIEDGVEIAEPSEWRLDAVEEGEDWFDLDLGVIVDGVRTPLLPLLLEASRSLKGRTLDELPDDFETFHEMPNGKILVLTGDRLRPLLKTLVELFGKPLGWPTTLKVSRAQAGELSLLDAAGLEWNAPERLREVRDRLGAFESLRDVPPPATLKGDLRPYQRQGLSWLQFLREYGFGGILADDMGLGKTVQTLAHILTEQEAGRLDRPALIVAPTSTLPNWRAEAARFAPGLRTLLLRGADRKARFEEIGSHDLIVTSYPLLARDREALAHQEFHLVVLDEAQNVKNPAAAATQAAASLRARHRICLSGTPVENRLDELWSLFNFLMPGFLGTLGTFRKGFRTPIETHGDADARRRLARRIRPFVLRRTKDLVATELPEKTTVVERVEMEGAQRDLYESVRLAMDARVRGLLAAKGFERSRIEILDALLKLRQACCDPRLVKLDAARDVAESAKLERLMELLGEALAEGRRVLLFSQFTTMLNLIEEELRKAGIDWVRISGDTDDRETPVQRFQSGEVSLFLISLRAGGTGLNLTAADTVIHYDPWWNPAVEAQATDRAHRIGQTKAVLVLKLVAEGTVEEKILELQEKKARLAEAVIGGGEFESSLTADELRWVFEEEPLSGDVSPA